MTGNVGAAVGFAGPGVPLHPVVVAQPRLIVARVSATARIPPPFVRALAQAAGDAGETAALEADVDELLRNVTDPTEKVRTNVEP